MMSAGGLVQLFSLLAARTQRHVGFLAAMARRGFVQRCPLRTAPAQTVLLKVNHNVFNPQRFTAASSVIVVQTAERAMSRTTYYLHFLFLFLKCEAMQIPYSLHV